MLTAHSSRSKSRRDLAAKSNNCRATDHLTAGEARTSRTELAKRVNATGDTAELQQENLGAKLYELEQRLTKVKNSSAPENIKRGKRQIMSLLRETAVQCARAPYSDHKETLGSLWSLPDAKIHPTSPGKLLLPLMHPLWNRDELTHIIKTRVSKFKEEMPEILRDF